MVDRMLEADPPCARDREDVQDTVDIMLRKVEINEAGSDSEFDEVVDLEYEY
jgi:hypothetical protein